MNLAPAPPLQLLPSYRVEPTRPSARAVSVCVANTVEA
jgi:hypothetical protein